MNTNKDKNTKHRKRNKNKGNKKALSNVVVVVLLILLAIIMVLIFLHGIKPILEETEVDPSILKTRLQLVKENICFYPRTNPEQVQLSIKRTAGKGDLTGIQFVFENASSSYIKQIRNRIKENEEKRFVISLKDETTRERYIENLERIMIYPIIRTEKGKLILGSIKAVYKVTGLELPCSSLLPPTQDEEVPGLPPSLKQCPAQCCDECADEASYYDYGDTECFNLQSKPFCCSECKSADFSINVLEPKGSLGANPNPITIKIETNRAAESCSYKINVGKEYTKELNTIPTDPELGIIPYTIWTGNLQEDFGLVLGQGSYNMQFNCQAREEPKLTASAETVFQISDLPFTITVLSPEGSVENPVRFAIRTNRAAESCSYKIDDSTSKAMPAPTPSPTPTSAPAPTASPAPEPTPTPTPLPPLIWQTYETSISAGSHSVDFSCTALEIPKNTARASSNFRIEEEIPSESLRRNICTEITTPSQIIEINEDIEIDENDLFNTPNGNKACFIIRADNVVLDFNEKTITYSGNDLSEEIYAIYSSASAKIKNGNINSFIDAGIYLTNNNNEISNMEIKNISGDLGAIYLSSSSTNTISDNILTLNKYALHLSSSSSNQIQGNTIYSNSRAIYLENSNSNNIGTLIKNNIEDNSEAILLESSSNNRFENNDLNLNSKGIYLVSSNNNEFSSNNLMKNAGTGESNYKGIFYLKSSKENIISGNTMQDSLSTLAEIMLVDSDSNTISDNNIKNPYSGFVYGESSSDNVISANNINNLAGKRVSYGRGINLWQSSNRNKIINNIMESSGWAGINIESDSNNNEIAGNRLTNMFQFGIRISGGVNKPSRNNIIRDNILTRVNYPQAAIYIHSSSFNTVSGNSIDESEKGIYLISSSDNQISDNRIDNPINFGVSLWQSNANSFSNIEISTQDMIQTSLVRCLESENNQFTSMDFSAASVQDSRCFEGCGCGDTENCQASCP